MSESVFDDVCDEMCVCDDIWFKINTTRVFTARQIKTNYKYYDNFILDFPI